MPIREGCVAALVVNEDRAAGVVLIPVAVVALARHVGAIRQRTKDEQKEVGLTAPDLMDTSIDPCIIGVEVVHEAVEPREREAGACAELGAVGPIEL